MLNQIKTLEKFLLRIHKMKKKYQVWWCNTNLQ